MTEAEKLNYLMNQGINAKQGMKYAGDSLDFYKQLITIFLNEYETMKEQIQKEANKTGKGYTVLVHALKNNARYLGADKLADLAYEHEQASKAGDAEYVRENLHALLETWEQTVHILKEI